MEKWRAFREIGTQGFRILKHSLKLCEC